MRKIFMVVGALVVFLFIAFSAYAVENNTWGRIKASFGSLEYRGNISLPMAKKPGGEDVNSSATQEPTADYPQSGAYTATWWARRDVYRGGALDLPNGSVFNFVAGSLTPPPDTPYGEAVTITMTCEKDAVADELVFSFGPSGCEFNPPARVWLSYSDLGICVSQLLDCTLMHGMRGSWVPVDAPALKDKVVKALSQWGWEPVDVTIEVLIVDWDIAIVKITAHLPGFSRYALSRCR